jgi:hypothetical protein
MGANEMRATELGRWVRRGAVVLVLGFGAATVGSAAAYADSTWDIPAPAVSSSSNAAAQQLDGGLAVPDDSTWD